MSPPARRRPIAFLFLGETLLIPHLWPIAEAMVEIAPDQPIDLWVATSVHEALLARWSAGLPSMRIRRVPGYRTLADDQAGRNPPLPRKPWMLSGLAPRLIGTPLAVCAEQTSLWIPRALPFHPTRFIKTSHGVGSMSARDDPRRRAARLMLVPSAMERDTYLTRGFDPARVLATGYVKAGFRQRTPPERWFADDRPILLYTPHWQRHRSSWWAWGREIVDALVAQRRFNVILAPHQRLAEQDRRMPQILAQAARAPHVHADWESFAAVDGSYTAAADLYLGDTSSQVVEYLARPRPCVFLNAQGVDWRTSEQHGFWNCGEVVDKLETLAPALARAGERHASYAGVQQTFADLSLGETAGAAPKKAARLILGQVDDCN